MAFRIVLTYYNASRAYISPTEGVVMSGLKYKVVLGLLLTFTALTASGCTVPLTIDCGPGLTCVP